MDHALNLSSISGRSLPDGGFPISPEDPDRPAGMGGMGSRLQFTPGSWRNGPATNGQNPLAAGTRRYVTYTHA